MAGPIGPKSGTHGPKTGTHGPKAGLHSPQTGPFVPVSGRHGPEAGPLSPKQGTDPLNVSAHKILRKFYTPCAVVSMSRKSVFPGRVSWVVKSRNLPIFAEILRDPAKSLTF